MKIKIVSYFTGKNQEYLKLLQATKILNSKYCELHGYEFDVVTVSEKEMEDIFWCIQF